ncbi:MAG: TerB family tellurite resistance protein [Deltaproteobacteria bacterium]|nr:TerB family tellurite resistance protein [Deltaproteobacteria bacterium]
MSLFRFLGLAAEAAPDAREPASLREITARLSSLPAEDARFVAAFAYLLARVAGADLDTASRERDTMAQRLESAAGLEPDRAATLADAAIAAAKTHSASDDHLVARAYRGMSSDDERKLLVRCLYAVAAADASITTVEDNEIFEIATEIGLGRKDVVALRAEFREHLAVLKALPRER